MLIIDAHCDSAGVQPAEEIVANNLFHGDFERLRQHVDLQFFAVFMSVEKYPDDLTAKILKKMESFVHVAAENQIYLLKSADDVNKIGKNSSVRGLLSLEGADALKGDLAILNRMYDIGLRSLGLTWNNDNWAAGGCGNNCYGLSPAGRELIYYLENKHILLDLAHCSEKTFYDVAGIAKMPFIVSHSCCADVYQFRHRNITDEQLRILGARGGVVGITFVPEFLAERNADISDIAAHLHHVIKKAGLQAAAIGSDFDGTATLPRGISGMQSWEFICEKLSDYFTYDEVEAICGGNLAALLKEVL